MASCTAAGWVVNDPYCDDPIEDPSCPATRDDANGQPCTTIGNYCFYGDFACLCTNCPPSAPACGGPVFWYCEMPHPDPDCPDDKPILGTPCAPEGQSCEYRCGPGGATLCQDGTWHDASGPPCPVSSRRFKQNIQYLAPEELRRLAEQVLAVRLAEYDYVSRPAGDQHHLGFIIEDHPDLPAVQANGITIDLYAYTSMVLATVQVQSQQIEALQQEVERLRALVRAPVCEAPVE